MGKDIAGFRIYRIEATNEQAEYILYDTQKKDYERYTKQRLLSILERKLLDRGISVEDVKEIVGVRNINAKQALTVLVDYHYDFVKDLGYRPVDSVTFQNESGEIFFNTYKKSRFLEMYEKGEFQGGNCDRILEWLDIITGRNHENFHFFMNWLAFILQNPSVKLPTCVILQSTEQGTGKSSFVSNVLGTIFGPNFGVIGQDDIESDFNGFIWGRQLLLCEEVVKNDQKIKMHGKLKSIVSEPVITLNEKYLRAITIRNYANLIFTSNYENPLMIESKDRRYTVFYSKKEDRVDEIISELLNDKEMFYTELSSFYECLVNRDVDFSMVSKAHENQERWEIIKSSMNSVEKFIHEAMEYEDGFIGLHQDLFSDPDQHPLYPDESSKIEIAADQSGNCYIPISNLYTLYKKFADMNGHKMKYTQTKFTQILRSKGFPTGRTRHQGRLCRVIYFGGHENEIDS